MNGKITFVIIPQKTSRIFRFQMHQKYLQYGKYAFILLFLLTGYVVVQYSFYVWNLRSYNQLVEQIRKQNIHYGHILEQIKENSSILSELSKFDGKLRILANQTVVNPSFEMQEEKPEFTPASQPEIRNLENQSLIVSSINQELQEEQVQTSLRSQSFYELKNFLVDQKEKLQSTPLIKPVKVGILTSPFGIRIDPFSGATRMHYGIDWAFLPFTPIFATANGLVEKSYYSLSYGNVVVINHLNGIKTLYAHMAKSEVKVGKKVKRGELIGRMGSTGNRSTATHLHYEILVKEKPVNPETFILEELPPASFYSTEY